MFHNSLKLTLLRSVNVLTLLVFLSLAVGCGSANDRLERMESNTDKLSYNTERMANELEADREYLKAMIEQMKMMATSLNEFQKLAFEMSKLIIQFMAKPEAPGPTDDIDDILTPPTTTETKNESI